MSTQRITRSGGMLAISMVQEAMNVIWPNSLCRFDFVDLDAAGTYPGNDEFESFREVIVSGKKECGAYFTARCKIGSLADKWQPVHIDLGSMGIYPGHEFDFALYDDLHASEAMFLIDPESKKVIYDFQS